MTEHKIIAERLFKEGCNCSQAVFAAFAKEIGLEKELALRLSSSFGGGIGRLREVCGALGAMELVAGAVCGYSDVSNKKIKDGHYALVQRLANEFKKEFGSYYCRDILKTDDTSPVSTERTADFYETRPCLSCIKTACDILDKELF